MADTVPETALSPREFRRRQRIQVGRDQLLDAAEDLFGFNGYHATSLEQVARRCEFSVGALYMFFGSKQELFEAVQLRRGPEQLAEMRACLEADLPGDQAVLRIASTILAFFHRHPGWGRLSTRMFNPGLDVLPPLEDLRKKFDQSLDVFATAIERGQGDGTVRGGDPHQLARLVSALLTAHHLIDPQLTPERDGMDPDELLDIIAAAIAPRRGNSSGLVTDAK